MNESIKEISYEIGIRPERKTWKQKDTGAEGGMGKQIKCKSEYIVPLLNKIPINSLTQ